MISVVLPCLNEVRHGYLQRILSNLEQQQGNKELIAVVSPCHDNTVEVVRQYPKVTLLETNARNRAQRLNAGIRASQGDVVLLHHPASLLPPHQALALIEAALRDDQIHWGGFRHSFDWDHWLLRFTSWYSNTVRPRWSKILYLDHCIFVRRAMLENIGNVPDMDIFEDTALSQQLATWGSPHLLSATVTTSARRFRQRGVYRQALLNQALKLSYHAHFDPSWMNRLYEHKSQINVRYPDPKSPSPPEPPPKLP